MKKSIYISQIIRGLMIITFLFWVFFNNSGLMKYMIIPFIICLILSTIKNICLLIGKDRYANIFNRLYAFVFLLFAFGFLIFWSYLVIMKYLIHMKNGKIIELKHIQHID